VATSGTIENPFGYHGALGYYVDHAAEGIYVRRRSYAPTLARWLSRDPMYPVLERDAYQYSRGSPLVFVDPAGTNVDYMLPEGDVGSICFLLNVQHDQDLESNAKYPLAIVEGRCPPMPEIAGYYHDTKFYLHVTVHVGRLCKDPAVCSNSYLAIDMQTTHTTIEEKLYWTIVPWPNLPGVKYIFNTFPFFAPPHPNPIMGPCTVRRTIKASVVSTFSMGRCCELPPFGAPRKLNIPLPGP
jgi:RHS repeat-associated protein